MSFVIDKSIPIPTNLRVGRTKYPLAEMEVGDSFFMNITEDKQQKNARSSMAARAKKLGMKVVSVADPTGVRVWRTA